MKISSKIDINHVYDGRKLKLYPTEEQKEILFRLIDNYRYVYNWGIAREQENYDDYLQGESNKSFISFISLDGEFTQYKRDHSEELDWLITGFSSTMGKLALKDVCNNYNKFFNGVNTAPPRFKSRKHGSKYFKLRKERTVIKNGKLYAEFFRDGNGIELKTNEYDWVDGFHDISSICSPMISFNNDYFTLSFEYVVEKQPRPEPEYITRAVGIDLGVRQTIVTSDGDVFNAPDMSKQDKQLARVQRQLNRDYERMREIGRQTKTKFDDIPKSKRCLKREARRRKIYRKKVNKMEYFIYQTVKTILDRNPEAVCMETIEVRDLYARSNHYARCNLVKTPFYKIRKIYEHQCSKRNIPCVLADPEYPSSQLCSNCGSRYKINSGTRTYRCKNCGMVMDRDINAAINLRHLYEKEDMKKWIKEIV